MLLGGIQHVWCSGFSEVKLSWHLVLTLAAVCLSFSLQSSVISLFLCAHLSLLLPLSHTHMHIVSPCCGVCRWMNLADIERIAPLEEGALPYHLAEVQRQVRSLTPPRFSLFPLSGCRLRARFNLGAFLLGNNITTFLLH